VIASERKRGECTAGDDKDAKCESAQRRGPELDGAKIAAAERKSWALA
jgi:hypothetical protein